MSSRKLIKQYKDVLENGMNTQSPPLQFIDSMLLYIEYLFKKQQDYCVAEDMSWNVICSAIPDAWSKDILLEESTTFATIRTLRNCTICKKDPTVRTLIQNSIKIMTAEIALMQHNAFLSMHGGKGLHLPKVSLENFFRVLVQNLYKEPSVQDKTFLQFDEASKQLLVQRLVLRVLHSIIPMGMVRAAETTELRKVSNMTDVQNQEDAQDMNSEDDDTVHDAMHDDDAVHETDGWDMNEGEKNVEGEAEPWKESIPLT